MLKEEAEWIEAQILKMLDNGQTVYPMANIGSSDGFNTRNQPWIGALIGSLRSKGEFKNIDIKQGDTIEITGDLLDDNFITELKSYGFRTFLCANILTNIRNKEIFIESLLKLVQPGDYLILTVSHRYPYMADPVDTLFRPSPEELCNYFQGTELVEQKLVLSDTYLQILWKRKKLLVITVARLFTPFYKFKTWLNLIKYFPQLNKPVSASCLILKKV